MTRSGKMRLLTVPVFGLFVIGNLVGLAGPAIGHQFSAGGGVSIGRSPAGAVEPGTQVTFDGKINSRRACKGGRSVSLVRSGGGTVDSTSSSPNGSYDMTVPVNETGRFLVRVASDTSGVHPHRHVCRGLTSDRIRVPVS